MNLKEMMPLELHERRLKLLKEVKDIDEEFRRRIHPIVTTIDEHRARAAHYASIGKRPY
jgi:hypothetical protein